LDIPRAEALCPCSMLSCLVTKTVPILRLNPIVQSLACRRKEERNGFAKFCIYCVRFPFNWPSICARANPLKKLSQVFDLPPSDGAKGRLGIADLKEGNYAAEEAFG